MKRLGAFVLAAVMMILCIGAQAATTLNSDGEQGVFTSKDTPASITDKKVVLEKEIIAFNRDETAIKAPTISYTYTIAPATVASDTKVTDSDKNGTVHETGVNVTASVKAGVGTPTISDSGVVAWSPSDTLTAATDGAKNVKDITIDFSSVVFTGAGVYRYEVTEALTSGYTYAASGVTKTTDPAVSATNPAKRYIDVYVRPAATGYTDGSTAAQWDIYGFTCFDNNQSITDADKTTGAVKTTGFTGGTTGGSGSSAFLADQYYTYNLTLTKTVENDSYSAANIAFPFTVILTNSNITKSIDIIGKVEAGMATGKTDPDAGLLSTGVKGVVNIKSGGQVKYIGIPNGTAFEVYETNTATGVTYKVTTSLTASSSVTTTNDNNVSWGNAPSSAAPQGSPKAAYQSTKASATPTANQDTDIDYTVAITNTLVNISPTGYISRYAPYALILVAGIVLLVIARKKKRHSDDE